MKTIHKYPLPIERYITIMMPSGARILKAGDQKGSLCVWALVDDLFAPTERRLLLLGTGHPAPSDIEEKYGFLDTVLMDGGDLVWHVWVQV